jgi:hypothetical protein
MLLHIFIFTIIFKREKTPIELALYVYSRSNSFRKTSKIISQNIKYKIALIYGTFFQIGGKEK